MHILFFSHYFPPEGNAPASRVYELCKRWVKYGHDVNVITCVPNVPDGVVYDGYKNRLVQKEIIDGIRTIRVWTFITANKGTFRRIINYLSYMFSATLMGMFIKKPDIIIATSPQFFCGWAGSISSRLRRVPFILEIRDIWPESIVAVDAMKNGCLLQFLEWLEHKMYRVADHIVTVGEGYRQRLLEKGVSEEKITIVMNGVDRDMFHPRDPDERLAQKLNVQGKFVCSYIGTVGMACGLDVVLQAATKLKRMHRDDIVFMIVGDGATKAELEVQAEEVGLNNIIFTGRLPKTQIPSVLSITNACFIHLKKTDLFKTVMPSKIFEAAGMARPIIIGVEGFAESIIKQANAGIAIEPENDQQLVEAVIKLADDSTLQEQYGSSGLDFIVCHFNRDDLANDYLAILSKVANGTIAEAALHS